MVTGSSILKGSRAEQCQTELMDGQSQLGMSRMIITSHPYLLFRKSRQIDLASKSHSFIMHVGTIA